MEKCKEIVTKIKFLVEDGRFRFIMSGSMLGIELVNIKSAPVGYLETLTVFPLDFEEFLQVFSVPERVSDSFVWLEKAGVAIPVYNATEPSLPLKLNSKSTLFKLFLSDVGLLTTLYGKATKLAILNNEADINRGAMYENVIAQEMHSHGLKLYYYNSKKQGELDFVIEYQNCVLPIEVKSGKDYDRHSALRNVMAIENYGLKEALVFYNGNVQNKNGCVYYPVYMAMFLQPEQISFENIKPFRW